MTIPITTPGTPRRARTPIAIIRRLAVVGATLALTALGVGVPAASAGHSESISTAQGFVKFQHDGEKLQAYDAKEGGYGVRAYLHWSSTESETVTADRSTGSGFAQKNLSIRERIPVELTICHTKNGVDVKCSLSQTGEA
jgi:hypothetical protein